MKNEYKWQEKLFPVYKYTGLLSYNISFRVETIDGSAVEGEDYEPINEILTFEPNEREKEVLIQLKASFTNGLS